MKEEQYSFYLQSNPTLKPKLHPLNGRKVGDMCDIQIMVKYQSL